MLAAIAGAQSSINLGSSRDDIAALRAAGCVVRFFHPLRPWMLDTINNRTHRRLLVADGTLVTIGSTNFDHRSFRLNDEINLTVYDREVGHRLEETFVSDPGRSRPCLYEQWKHRPLKERLSKLLVMPFRSEL